MINYEDGVSSTSTPGHFIGATKTGLPAGASNLGYPTRVSQLFPTTGTVREESTPRPALSARQSEAIARLEELARHDPGNRGLSSKARAGLLLPAAQALVDAKRVMLVTGFCVRSAMIGETDGPPGTASLTSCLNRMGAATLILTDKYSSALVTAALAAYTLPSRTLALYKPPTKEPALDKSIPVAILPHDDKEAGEVCLDLVKVFAPDLILAVERPGSASDGHRYSMRGALLDDIAPSADLLFANQGQRWWKTAAIGDGGNELGMGSLRDSCMDSVALGPQIFCASGSDYPVISGISNWGAYALAGAVSILAGRIALPDPDQELAALREVYRAGGVDGATREHSFSVDGLAAEEYLQTIRSIHKLVLESL